MSASLAVSRLYNGLMAGLVLTLITRAGNEAAREFVFRHFRRQHEQKFLAGLKKLGLDTLPHAVACSRYHAESNALGGVKTELLIESDRKAWVRYPPPRWIWPGVAICAVPTEVNAAMLHGWHGHNGVSLGNPRLGFVCTGQTTEGDPGLEGYYCEYDRPLAEHERVRFASDERAPRIDPSLSPVPAAASWPAERIAKAGCRYAMEYVRTLVPVMLELHGEEGTRVLLGRAARLTGLQLYEDTAALAGTTDFGGYLAALCEAQGESVTRDGATIRLNGWRLMQGLLPLPRAAFDAWNELWVGACLAADRHAILDASYESATDTPSPAWIVRHT